MDSVAECPSAMIQNSPVLADPLETADADKDNNEPSLACKDAGASPTEEAESQMGALPSDLDSEENPTKSLLEGIENVSVSPKASTQSLADDIIPLQDKNPLDISEAESENLDDSGSDRNYIPSNSSGEDGLARIRQNRKHVVNFDHLLNALDLVAEGVSLTAAAKRFKVPYYRLHTFLKGFYVESSDEDEDEVVKKSSAENKKSGKNLTDMQNLPTQDIQSVEAETVTSENKLANMKAEGPVAMESSGCTNIPSKSAMLSIPADIVKEFTTNVAVATSTANTVKVDPMLSSPNGVNGSLDGRDPAVKSGHDILSDPCFLTKLKSPQLAIENGGTVASTPSVAVTKPSEVVANSSEVIVAKPNNVLVTNSSEVATSSEVAFNKPDEVDVTKSNGVVVPPSSFDEMSEMEIEDALLKPLSPSSETADDVSLSNSELTELTVDKSSDTPSEIERAMEVKENEEVESGTLKRSRSSLDEAPESKRHKSESPVASPKAVIDSNGRADLNEQLSKVTPASLKLRKLKRKDLEVMVMTLFKETLLYSHDLGKYKDLCEGLETSLEHHRKKSTQYFKELDDLRKITGRLQEEHNARKDQVTMPIRIKRSVGVQAAPHIINRAHQTSQHNLKGVRLIGPSPTVAATLKNPAPPLSLPTPPPVSSTQQPTAPNGTRTYASVAATHTVGAPEGQRRFFVRQPINTPSTVAVCSQAATAGKQNGAFNVMANKMKNGANPAARGSNDLIDLTDEGEAKTQPKPVGRPPNPPHPYTSNAIPTATPTAPASTRPTLAPSRPTPAPVRPTAPAPRPAPHPGAGHHPAPLPVTAVQQVVGGAKKLPPQPTLKLSHKDNSIVLSWSMTKTEEHEVIASYQLYAYQEGAQKPSSSLWKKVGSVKALELPMACTLTQFMPGHRYHFAVRAVDSKNRVGVFSDPRSIRLERSN